MPDFVLTYRHPADYAPTPESGAAWMAWFDGMTGQLVDLGKPVIERASIGDPLPGATVLGGYSVVRADDLQAAVALATGCPLLNHGGTVEVGRLGEVPELAQAKLRAAGAR
jgi:hypothetical protein